MKKEAHLEIDFREVEKSYSQIQKKAYESVAEWHWTKGYFNLEPYYSELNQFPKSRRLKKEPDQKYGHYKHGFDSEGRIVIELSYPTPFLDKVKETFFEYDRLAQCTVVSEFKGIAETPSGELPRLDGLEVFEYDQGLLKRQHTLGSKRYWYKDFVYDDAGKLTETRYLDHEGIDRTTHYSYNAKGELDQIVNNHGTRYRKLPKALPKIAADVEQALYEDVVQTIADEDVKEEVFSLFLSYSSTGFHLPPELYICTADDKLRLFDTSSKAHIAENELWEDVAAFQYEIYFGDKTPHRELYDLYLQAIEMKNQYNKMVSLIINVAKRLQEHKTELGLTIADDFLVMASDYDMNDTKKNYKKIHGKK